MRSWTKPMSSTGATQTTWPRATGGCASACRTCRCWAAAAERTTATSRQSRSGWLRQLVEADLLGELGQEVFVRLAGVEALEELGGPQSRPHLPADTAGPVLGTHLVRRRNRHFEAVARRVDALIARDHRVHAAREHGEALCLLRVVVLGGPPLLTLVGRLHREQ